MLKHNRIEFLGLKFKFYFALLVLRTTTLICFSVLFWENMSALDFLMRCNSGNSSSMYSTIQVDPIFSLVL